uniref:Uncharacterized protein n=1 Tax=Ciona intestinalis TaxID=7719 RepID=H2XP36_CIOIN
MAQILPHPNRHRLLKGKCFNKLFPPRRGTNNYSQVRLFDEFVHCILLK